MKDSSEAKMLSNGRPIPLITRHQTFFFGDISRGMCTKTIHRVSKTWKQRFVSKSAKFPGQCAKKLFKILRRELGLVLPTTGLTSSNDCNALKELKTYEYYSYRCSKLLKNVSMFTKFVKKIDWNSSVIKTWLQWGSLWRYHLKAFENDVLWYVKLLYRNFLRY